MDTSDDAAVNDVGPSIFNVCANTVPLALASAIAKMLRKRDALVLQAIGPGAVSRATQALIIARVLLGEDGNDLGFMPMFGKTTVGDKTLIGMIFEVEQRPCTAALPIRLTQQ